MRLSLLGVIPSILSVSYIPEVEHLDLDKFIINARGLGYFNYELKSDEVKDTYYPFIKYGS